MMARICLMVRVWLRVRICRITAHSTARSTAKENLAKNANSIGFYQAQISLFVIVFSLVAGGQTLAQSDNPTPLAPLAALAEQIETASAEDVTVLLADNHAAILADPQLSIAAVVALQRIDEPQEAIALAQAARNRHPKHRGLILAQAISHWHANDCTTAIPLLHQAHAHSTDKIAADAERFLANCAKTGRWIFGKSYSIGYDSHLWQGGRRRTITPEEGSVFDMAFDGFNVAPINRSITLGRDAPSSPWLGVAGQAHYTWRDKNRQNRITLGGYANHATRQDYWQAQASIALERSSLFGSVRYKTGLLALTRLTENGADLPSIREDTLVLNQSLLMLLSERFGLIGGGRGRLTEIHNRGRTIFTHNGAFLALMRTPDLTPTPTQNQNQTQSQTQSLSSLGWRVEAFAGIQADTNRYHTAEIKQLAVAIGPISLADGVTLNFGQGLAQLDYRHPRPWLRTPHREYQWHWNMVLSYPFGVDNSAQMRVSITKRDSPDPFDTGTKASFTLEFPL